MPATANPPPRAWWQEGTRESFRGRVQQMPIKELELLAGDMSAALSEIAGQLAVHNPDREWRERALKAQAATVGRRQIVTAQLQFLHAGRASARAQARTALVTKAREHARAGELREALELLIDWVEGKAEGQRS